MSRRNRITNKKNILGYCLTCYYYYKQCLFNREIINGINKGFRVDQKEMKTYEQNKIGLSPVYTKGVVMDDGIHIRPIIF